MKKNRFLIFCPLFLTFLCSVMSVNAQPGGTTVKNALDKGDFKVGFSPKTKAKDPKKAMPADEQAVLQEIATSLNQLIALPRNVYLNFDTCGEANAFYDPETTEITICYELLDQFESEFKTISKDQKRIDAMVEDTLVQTFFHELGHCLIDVWDLPATGREEDAVDQLATVLLLDGSPEGRDSAINAAIEFEIASRSENKASLMFWDEHSFSKTRFYDMMCLVYGSDPQKNGNLVGPKLLPIERAERCPNEYKRAERAWLRLLEPYILK
ncbi:MAG: DUF4344 domain-containing metallopeptidase [Pyrinomonadaceae bacterium]|nr:DUF4344 domain-containing metallopeptidase [Pyrinomonadaceae bacterium]